MKKILWVRHIIFLSAESNSSEIYWELRPEWKIMKQTHNSLFWNSLSVYVIYMRVCHVCACVPVEARGQSPVSALSSPCSLRQNCSLTLTLTDSRDWLANVHHSPPPQHSLSLPLSAGITGAHHCAQLFAWELGSSCLYPLSCLVFLSLFSVGTEGSESRASRTRASALADTLSTSFILVLCQ